ncbi:MAG: ABC transporter permease [Nitriliruptoraceae bacterium]|nr:ABC transporter permease [Nitriliruptoraceae bacterium]
MGSAALTILGKDLRLRLRDRSVWIFALAVPLGLTVLFSLIFPDTEDLQITGAVVDLDGGAVAAGFADGVIPALVDEGLLERIVVADAEAARSQVTDGDLDVAWILPVGFSDAIGAGEQVELEVLVAAGRSLEGEVARGIAEAYAAEVGRIGLAVTIEAAMTGGLDPGLIGGLGELAASQPRLASLADEVSDVGDPLDFTSYLAAGMAAFFVFFTVQFGVTGLLEERKLGTMPRLLAAPIRPAAIQAGKLLGALLLGLASMVVLAVASAVLLGADWGPPLGTAILIVALVIAALGVMALVGSFARTAEQAGNLQSIVAVVLGLVGGVFFPLPGDAGVLRIATLISPHGWFLRGLDAQASAGDWTLALGPAAAIVAFGIVTAIPAVVLQRRRQAW